MIAWTDAERDEVASILRAHLPAGAKVFAFGSRVTERAKPYSDLDLAVQAHKALSMAERIDLQEAFVESNLPWKVDLLDLSSVSQTFRAVIADQLTPVEFVA